MGCLVRYNNFPETLNNTCNFLKSFVNRKCYRTNRTVDELPGVCHLASCKLVLSNNVKPHIDSWCMFRLEEKSLFCMLTWASPLNISISRHLYSLERHTRVLLRVGYHMPCMSAGDRSELLCSPDEQVLVLVLREDSILAIPLSSLESTFATLSSDPN